MIKGGTEFLYHFHVTRDYFECHEVGEEHWKEQTDPKIKQGWLGLIQLAVSLYHWRRGNDIGAKKMIDKAQQTLLATREIVQEWKIQDDEFLSRIHNLKIKMEKGEGYESMELPMEKHMTLWLLKRKEEQKEASCSSEWFIHKHQYRDRTEVIQARAEALEERKKRIR